MDKISSNKKEKPSYNKISIYPKKTDRLIKRNKNIILKKKEYNNDKSKEISKNSENSINKKKKVSFKQKKDLVTIINIESYKNYNMQTELTEMDINENNIKNKKDKSEAKKVRRNPAIKKKRYNLDLNYNDKDADIGNLCLIF